MLRLRYLVPVLGLSSLVAAACSDDGVIITDGDAGEGGEAVGGEGPGPGPGPGGAGGEVSSMGGGCSEDGAGTLVVEISGLPADVEADVQVVGPDELAFTTSDTIMDVVAAGTYTVTAARVY